MSEVTVSEIRTFVVAVAPGINWIFLKLTCSDGLHGWGECTLEGKDETVLGAVQDLKRGLIGKPVPGPLIAWQRHVKLAAWRGAALYTAISAFDQALWDLRGKRADVPVFELLGGPVRSSLPVYTWAGAGHDAVELAREAEDANARYGYTHFKVAPLTVSYSLDRTALRQSLDELETIAGSLPPNGRIAIEGHGRLLPPAAAELCRAVSHLPIMFVEDLVNPDDDEAIRTLRARTDLPIASGEKRFTRGQVATLVRDRLVDYLLIDLCHAGGITETLRIAAVAEPAGISIVPHNPNGPVGMAATLQAAAASPNIIAAESVHTRFALMEALTGTPVEVRDGRIDLPKGAGLGVELIEEQLEAHKASSADFPFSADVVVPGGAL